jgi:prolyl-tRNA editing enzyme YbaK/EbsC (Cys-tRNA(Pro) deacylase)
MWPAEVEAIAAPLRAAGIEARLEELPRGERDFPGAGATAVAFECGGGIVVALVPAGEEADPRKVAGAAGCEPSARREPPALPFSGTRVLLEQRLLAHRILWLEAGSPRYVLGLEPAILQRITRATAADLTRNG